MKLGLNFIKSFVRFLSNRVSRKKCFWDLLIFILSLCMSGSVVEMHNLAWFFLYRHLPVIKQFVSIIVFIHLPTGCFTPQLNKCLGYLYWHLYYWFFESCFEIRLSALQSKLIFQKVFNNSTYWFFLFLNITYK